jgi:hypothetical protein
MLLVKFNQDGGFGSYVVTIPIWVNTMIGNVKRSIDGTYHAINHKHLSRYLAEFCYRLDRRFVLEDMLPRLCYVSAQAVSKRIKKSSELKLTPLACENSLRN